MSKDERELIALCTQKKLSQENIDRLRILALDESKDINTRLPYTVNTLLMSLCRNVKGDNLFEALKALLQREGINVTLTNRFHQDALMLLVLNYHHPNLILCVRLLIKHGASVLTKDKKNKNALLHLCEKHGKSYVIDVARLLIQQRSEFTKEAIELLRKRGHPRSVNLLIKVVDSYNKGNAPNAVSSVNFLT